MTCSTEQRKASVFTVAVLGLLIASPSHAYLDPGTGSIILQGLLAGTAVGIGVLHRYWQQFKSFLSRQTNRSRDHNDDGEPEFEQNSNIQSKS
ncbi:MAG: hypothetical protein IIA09_13800 [Proteobacteria bacterium]|nr:hypothetical protein [Pseudomonadota bacterium]